MKKHLRLIPLLLTVFSITTSALSAGIEKYFKKAENKPVGQQIRNIDFIYMINLDQRPEKFELSLKQLEPYGIRPYRFSAVNGWELTNHMISELGVVYEPWMENPQNRWVTYYPLSGGEHQHELPKLDGKSYFCHCMSRGAIGIVLSHLSILQDAYNSGYETIWVMEDDIEVIKDPHTLSDLIDELDDIVGENGWDILFTDQDTKNQEGLNVPCTAYAWRPNFDPDDPFKCTERWDVSEEFRFIGSRYGAYSMIVRRSGMEKLLKFFKTYNIFLPFDMDMALPPKIRFFNLRNEVVSTLPKAISDNGNANYKNRSE